MAKKSAIEELGISTAAAAGSGVLGVNDVEQIVKMIDNGISVTEISKIYQVHYSTISNIKHRKTWKYSI